MATAATTGAAELDETAELNETAALRTAAERFAAAAAALEPSRLSATEAEAVVAASVRVANAAQHAAAVAARRVGETGAHRRCGDRTEAHHLARIAGVGVGVARSALGTVGRLDDLDATRRAAQGGELSPRQAAAISEAAAVDPAAEGRLLRMARSRSLGDLEEECARVRAAAAPDDEEQRRRRAQAERGCWRRRGRDGSAEIVYRSSLDEVAEAWATIGAFRDRLFRDRPADAPRESFDNRSADGFLDMTRAAASLCGATDPTPAGAPAWEMSGDEPQLPIGGAADGNRWSTRPRPAPAKVIVRVDWDALIRGYPISGEVSEIDGLGPVPVSAVRDIIRSGDPFLAAVVTRGTDVVSVAHLGRAPSARQRTALEWMRPRCRAEGCDRTVGLEVDHTLPWAATKFTLLGLLDWLCTHHHDLKSHKGWALVAGKGVRPLVPPDDPRHPSRAGP